MMAGLLLAAPARADEQLWLAGVAAGPIAGRAVVRLEVQPRFTDGAGRLGQAFLRPAIGVQINPATQLLLGYAFVENNPAGQAAVREHRLWQQAQLQLAGTPGSAVLTSRTRLEQRVVEGSRGTGWRLRQLVRGQLWLDERWSLIAASETFIGLNQTQWGQQARVEQQRSFAGVGVPLNDRMTLEAGYLNQRIFRDGPDATNHVLNLNLLFRLG